MPTTAVAVAANNKVLLQSVLNTGDEDLTLRRVRGLLTVQTDQVAASELMVGAFGIGVFTATALAAGIASLPDPVTDVTSDLWATYVHVGQQLIVGTNVGLEPHWATQYEFDSKAMRKIAVGYGLGFIIANASATTGFQVSLSFRTLFSETGR